MKSLSTKINESLVQGPFSEHNDAITREFNNLFGMYNNVLMRKVDHPEFDCLYVITGSAIRRKDNWVALTVPCGSVSTVDCVGRSISTTPGQFFEKYDLCAINWRMDRISEDEQFNRELLDACQEFVKDFDFIIVIPKEELRRHGYVEEPTVDPPAEKIAY